MSVQQHVIRKLVMEVFLGKKEKSYQIQDKFVSVSEHELLAVMEEIFSRCSSPDQMIEIDKLELDLGNLKSDDILKEFSQKFSEKLSQELSKIGEAYVEEGDTFQKKQFVETEQEAFIYFLKHGRVPWWSEKEISISKLFDKLLTNRKDNFIKALLNELNVQRSLVRFIHQFSDHQIALFISETIPFKQQSIYNLLKEEAMPAILLLKLEKPLEAREIIWKNIIHHFYTNSFSEFKKEVLQNLIQQLAGKKVSAIDLQLKQKLSRKEKKKKKKNEKESPKASEKEKIISENSTDENDLVLSEPESFGLRKQDFDDNEDETLLYDKDEIYVENAGLVLFWPYLTTFFRACGLLDQNNFKDSFSHNKALYILQYLASSGNEIEEHLLVLNKIMSGWPIDQVPQRYELSAMEKEEADHLVATLVEHWKVLKDTSPESLRETFIRRPGILTSTDGQDWKLRVEKRGVDILMGALPWGISIIRLPWMEYTIRVEW
jgi:hypothetical protein